MKDEEPEASGNEPGDGCVRYAPPGKPTRQRDKSKIQQPSVTAAPTQSPSPATYNEAIVVTEDVTIPGVIAQIEAAIDAPGILAAAPPILRQALQLIHYSDKPIGDVARTLGMSRFQLYREMEAFASDFRAAA